MVLANEDSENDGEAAASQKLQTVGITGNFFILMKLFLGSHIRTHTPCYND